MRIDKKSIPSEPGVYFFRDGKRRILYIGKAANLKNRLGSYFDSRPKDPRISKMLSMAASMNYQLTGSEIEALILESRLIKKYRPDFNIMLRDDKQYFYVVFTKERFPKIFVTHQPAKQTIDLSQTVGPFTDGTALKSTLRLLRKIFPYCTCFARRPAGKQGHANYCLNYHIGKCLGFCCLKGAAISRTQLTAYKKNLRAVKDILNGKRADLIKKLEKDMIAKGGQNKFKEAISLRTQIEKLKQVFENARVIQELYGNASTALRQLQKSLGLPAAPSRIEGYDVSNIQGKFPTGSMVVFTDGQPDKNEYRKFKLYGGHTGDTAMLQEVLSRRFKHKEWRFPDLILIDGGKGQLNAAVKVARGLGLKIPIAALTKNERHVGDHLFATTLAGTLPLSKMPREARDLVLRVDAEAHRFAISYYRAFHKKQL